MFLFFFSSFSSSALAVEVSQLSPGLVQTRQIETKHLGAGGEGSFSWSAFFFFLFVLLFLWRLVSFRWKDSFALRSETLIAENEGKGDKSRVVVAPMCCVVEIP